MNIENINATIDFLKIRTWHSHNFSMHDDCMVGIIGHALHGDRAHARSDDSLPFGSGYIAEMLGIGIEPARAIYVMNQHNSPFSYASLWRFAELTTERQNRVLIGMLESLRDSGGVNVHWNINA